MNNGILAIPPSHQADLATIDATTQPTTMETRGTTKRICQSWPCTNASLLFSPVMRSQTNREPAILSTTLRMTPETTAIELRIGFMNVFKCEHVQRYA